MGKTIDHLIGVTDSLQLVLQYVYSTVLSLEGFLNLTVFWHIKQKPKLEEELLGVSVLPATPILVQ